MGRSRKRIPDGIEPIIGYRMWKFLLGQRRAELHPLSSSESEPGCGSDWDGAGSRWVVASCWQHGPGPGHVAPVKDCGCGFHAYKSLDKLSEDGFLRAITAMDTGLARSLVLGRVQLAGKIIEHDYGYRAERARIAELIPLRGTEHTVILLAARLELPIGDPVTPPPLPLLASIGTAPRFPPPGTRRPVAWIPAEPLFSPLDPCGVGTAPPSRFPRLVRAVRRLVRPG